MGVKLLLSAELAAPARASSALECRRLSGDTAHTFGLRASPNVRQARSPIAGRGSGAASPRFPARCEGSSESNARPGSGRRCGRRNTVPSERISWTLPPAPTRFFSFKLAQEGPRENGRLSYGLRGSQIFTVSTMHQTSYASSVLPGQDGYRGSPAAAVIRRSCLLVLFPLGGNDCLDSPHGKLRSGRKLIAGVLLPIGVGDVLDLQHRIVSRPRL